MSPGRVNSHVQLARQISSIYLLLYQALSILSVTCTHTSHDFTLACIPGSSRETQPTLVSTLSRIGDHNSGVFIVNFSSRNIPCYNHAEFFLLNYIFFRAAVFRYVAFLATSIIFKKFFRAFSVFESWPFFKLRNINFYKISVIGFFILIIIARS